MLSAHEISTLLVLKSGSEPADRGRMEVDMLARRGLVRLAASRPEAALTEAGNRLADRLHRALGPASGWAAPPGRAR